jgi:AAA domain, putative AbiEii toxin, Type IV TA system
MEIRKSHLTFILGEFLVGKPDQHARFCALVLAMLKVTHPDEQIETVAENVFSVGETLVLVPQEIELLCDAVAIVEFSKQWYGALPGRHFLFNAPKEIHVFVNSNQIENNIGTTFHTSSVIQEGVFAQSINFSIFTWGEIFPFWEKNPSPLSVVLQYENNEALPSRAFIFDIWRKWLGNSIESAPLEACRVLIAWIKFAPRSVGLPDFIADWLNSATNQHAAEAGDLFDICLQKDLNLPLLESALLRYLEKNFQVGNQTIKRIFLSLARRGENIVPFAKYIKDWLLVNFEQKDAGPIFSAWIRQGLPTEDIGPEMASWLLTNASEISAGPIFVELLAAGYKAGVIQQNLLEWLESPNGLTPEAGTVFYTWLQLGIDNDRIKKRLQEWRIANPNHPDIYRIAQLVSGVSQALDKYYPAHPITIQSLRLAHVRKYAEFGASFATPSDHNLGQWVVILGENGVGKTTLLRSMVLALRNVEKRDIWPTNTFTDWESVNTPEHAQSEITVETNGRPYLTRIPAPGEIEQEPRMQGNSVYPLFAYGCRRGSALGGALRAVEMGGGMEVATLFDEGAALVHAETWLKELDGDAAKSEQAKALFDNVIEALKSMLMVDDVYVRDMAVWVQEAGRQAVPFRYLSDAYLTTAGWFLDLLARWLHMARQENIPVKANFMAEMRGLVLIDEIDLHLHPRLQIDIIPRTRKLIPQMSFVVTTHNALTLLGARPEEIRILREVDGVPSMEPGIEPPQLLTPAQILHSYFGIDGYHPSEIGRALKRYAFLADFALRNDAEEAELMQLRDTLAAANSLPDWEITPRELPGMETANAAGAVVAGEVDDTPA